MIFVRIVFIILFLASVVLKKMRLLEKEEGEKTTTVGYIRKTRNSLYVCMYVKLSSIMHIT